MSDDGGDATMRLHLGPAPSPTPPFCTIRQEEETRCSPHKQAHARPKWYSTRLAKIKGVTAETTPGCLASYQMHK